MFTKISHAQNTCAVGVCIKVAQAVDNKYPSIKVLHDDAFVINAETCASVALEPTYFDKTADYKRIVMQYLDRRILVVMLCMCKGGFTGTR